MLGIRRLDYAFNKKQRLQNRQLIASEGVDAIKNGEEIDPHAWQSFDNIRVYIQNITGALIALRPQHADELTRRQQQYLKHLHILEKRLLAQMANILPTNVLLSPAMTHLIFGTRA